MNRLFASVIGNLLWPMKQWLMCSMKIIISSGPKRAGTQRDNVSAGAQVTPIPSAVVVSARIRLSWVFYLKFRFVLTSFYLGSLQCKQKRLLLRWIRPTSWHVLIFLLYIYLVQSKLPNSIMNINMISTTIQFYNETMTWFNLKINFLQYLQKANEEPEFSQAV